MASDPVREVSGLDAEAVAALCLLLAEGEAALPLPDLIDIIGATERRAHTSFGPVPGALSRALAGLGFEAGLADPESVRQGALDAALAQVSLGALLPHLFSRDRLWFADGGVHWTRAAPGSEPGRAAQVLLGLMAQNPKPSDIRAALEHLGWNRASVWSRLDRDRDPDPDDLRREAAWQDWFE